MSTTAEWTLLEKLMLAQAVYKLGEEDWVQIASNLNQNSLLNRQPDFFNKEVAFDKQLSKCFLPSHIELYW